MGRLVVVSNRVADPRKPGAGGLAVALADALQSSATVARHSACPFIVHETAKVTP